MNKHEEAREDLELIESELVTASNDIYEHINNSNDIITLDKNWNVQVLGDNFKRLQDYILQCEATEKAYEQLVRDVKMFMDSVEFTLGDIAIYTDLGKLIERLKKVGNE